MASGCSSDATRTSRIRTSARVACGDADAPVGDAVVGDAGVVEMLAVSVEGPAFPQAPIDTTVAIASARFDHLRERLTSRWYEPRFVMVPYPPTPGALSVEFGETRRYHLSVPESRISALAHEREDTGSESRPERLGFDRSNVGTIEASEGLIGKIVVAACLHRGQPLAEASERERVIAHRADIVLRLPETPALDARARVERVDDAPPEDVVCDRWRGDEEARWDR
jgi:hypothetical protein